MVTIWYNIRGLYIFPFLKLTLLRSNLYIIK
jgi:hypothetical protein